MLMQGILMCFLLSPQIQGVVIRAPTEKDDLLLTVKEGERVDVKEHTSPEEKKRSMEAAYKPIMKRESIPPPSDADVEEAKKSYNFNCEEGDGFQDPLTTVSEFYGAAQAIAGKSQAPSIAGWTTPGTVSIGPDIKDRKKFAKCTPIHCLSSSDPALLKLCGSGEFKYGFGIDTQLLGELLLIAAKVCNYGSKSSFVPEFSITSKNGKFKGMSIQARADSCKAVVTDVCLDTSDQGKADCLFQKNFFGVPWQEASEGPTTD